jgi:hypothetical protein
VSGVSRGSRWVRLGLAMTFVALSACTSSPHSPTPSAPSSVQGSLASVMVLGKPLPTACTVGLPSPLKTVMFTAGGHLWAMDPYFGDVTCVLNNAGSDFLLGPQGNRALLDGFQVAGWGAEAPNLPATGVAPASVGWSRPQGTAIIYANKGVVRPDMYFLKTGHTIPMTRLPDATYLEFAYHPTGLAIGYILKRKGSEAIWYSRNDGTKAKPLVFTKEGTTFSDLTFSRDGGTMYYIAHHRAGYSELHFIDLTRPKNLLSIYRSPLNTYWKTFSLAPFAERAAVTQGTSCEDSTAKLLPNFAGGLFPVQKGVPLLPDATGPTRVLGWFDNQSLLVAEGGCGRPEDLWAVNITGNPAPELLASGVDEGAFRDTRPNPPTTLPRAVRIVQGPGVG